MIQQESQNVWGYGRGMVRTIARVTNTSDGFITLGPMLFTQLAGPGAWQVDLDVAGPTYLRYAAARILYSTSDDFQAHVTIDDSDPEVPFGSRLLVQVWDVNGGGVPADDPEDLQLDAALCIEVIVNQSGEPKYNTGPGTVALPPPPPIPPPVP